MEGFQTMSIPLGSQAWAANSPLTFNMSKLPVTQGLAVPHVISFDFELDLDPVYTTAPTTFGHNAAIKTLSINDGQREWFPMGGGFNLLRAFERLETGKPLLPDALLGGGTGNNRFIRRRFFWNPPNLYGQPSDGAYNCPFLAQSGVITVTCGALTDISADCTAATGTLRVYANVARYFNKLIFPAFYPRRIQPFATGQEFKQRALYGAAAFLNSVNFDAFAANDIGDVTINLSGDIPMLAGSAPALTAAFQADMRTFQIDSVMGEPRDATYDVAPRTTNLTTPTALQAQPADMQPFAWIPIDTRLTKLPLFVPNELILSISGGNSGTQIIHGRYEPVDGTSRAEQLKIAIDKLGRGPATSWGLRLADDSLEYNGPLRDFFPWQAKVGTLPMSGS